LEQRRQSPDWRSLSRRAAWVSVAILRHRMHRALPLAGRRRPHWAQRPAALWRRYSFSRLTGGILPGRPSQGAWSRWKPASGPESSSPAHPGGTRPSRASCSRGYTFLPIRRHPPWYSRPRIVGPASFCTGIANWPYDPQFPAPNCVLHTTAPAPDPTAPGPCKATQST
jgi:hypothetical protein